MTSKIALLIAYLAVLLATMVGFVHAAIWGVPILGATKPMTAELA